MGPQHRLQSQAEGWERAAAASPHVLHRSARLDHWHDLDVHERRERVLGHDPVHLGRIVEVSDQTAADDEELERREALRVGLDPLTQCPSISIGSASMGAAFPGGR